MSDKPYRTLPDACSDFTLEMFDNLKNPDGSEFQFVVIQENPDVQEPWLCENCVESECTNRKAEYILDDRFKS